MIYNHNFYLNQKSVTKKLTSKVTTGAKGEGGTDSGNTSRASTPVSDRSVKVSSRQIFIFHLNRSIKSIRRKNCELELCNSLR